MCQLFQDNNYKELLLFVVKYSKTEDLKAIINTLSINLAFFLEHAFGIQMIQFVFEYHSASENFKVM